MKNKQLLKYFKGKKVLITGHTGFKGSWLSLWLYHSGANVLGVSDKRNQKVKDDNLLNFYLSSITVKDFKYEPNNKTKKSIWEYMNAANLIKIDDISDKEKINRIENAANRNQIDKNQIFKIYKQIPFDLNSTHPTIFPEELINPNKKAEANPFVFFLLNIFKFL